MATLLKNYDTSPSPESIKVLLQRVAEEMRIVSASIDEIATPLHECRGSQADVRVPAVQLALQRLDLMCQTVACLGNFLESLAHAAPLHWRIDATSAGEALALSNLIDRLLRRQGEIGPDRAISGDADLF